MSPLRPLAAGALAAGVTTAAAGALAARPPGGRKRWERTNHAGRTVSLLEGPSYVAGAVAGAALGGPAAVIAAAAAGTVGLLDDLAGATDVKGLRGHLGALRQGRVTTGAIKVGVLAATGVVSAALADAQHRRSGRAIPGGAVARVTGTALGALVIAGSANVVNLFDLRPGRALKVTTLAGLPLLGSVPPAAAVGAAAACLPGDLAGRTMLGDTGANAAGALLGLAVVDRCGLPGRAVAAATLAGLVLASERVSFSTVIANTPVLRELDALGRPRTP